MYLHALTRSFPCPIESSIPPSLPCPPHAAACRRGPPEIPKDIHREPDARPSLVVCARPRMTGALLFLSFPHAAPCGVGYPMSIAGREAVRHAALRQACPATVSETRPVGSCSSLVEHSAVIADVAGSNPATTPGPNGPLQGARRFRGSGPEHRSSAGFPNARRSDAASATGNAPRGQGRRHRRAGPEGRSGPTAGRAARPSQHRRTRRPRDRCARPTPPPRRRPPPCNAGRAAEDAAGRL